MAIVCDDALSERFRSMFACDSARIVRPGGKLFLILGRKRHTKDSPGQWFKNGAPHDFEYQAEEVVASGSTVEELTASAEYYKSLSWCAQRDDGQHQWGVHDRLLACNYCRAVHPISRPRP